MDEKNIKLKIVSNEDIEFLYDLLKERLDYSDDLDYILKNDFPSFEKHSKFIQNFIDNTSENTFDSFYVIQISEDECWKSVGSIVLKKDHEWGYHLLKKYWDQGIGSKALSQLLDKNKDKTLIGRTTPENKRAIHNMEKFGFKLKELTFVKEPTD